jgi:flavin-dependent dehydrogenase
VTRPELVVVGGGPAGAAIAAMAAAAGVRTLVIERDRFPRDKVCGEFVSAEGCAVLARLGLLPTLSAKGAMPMDA